MAQDIVWDAMRIRKEKGDWTSIFGNLYSHMHTLLSAHIFPRNY